MSSRVLVVDDNSTNRRLMQATLEAKYYTVMLAANGPEALAAALNFSPQVILLDIMMPGMDGFEVCRRLKSDDRTRHIPVVMLTALNDAEDRVRGLNAGADDFLSKPVAEVDLTARLDTLTRYYEVANELRQRSAPGAGELNLTTAEQEVLDRPGGVLIIDGDRRNAERVAKPLREAGHDAVVWDKNLNADIDFNGGLGLVIVSLSDQQHDALRLVAQLRSLYFDKYIAILVSFVQGDEKIAFDALKLGANDLVMEPMNPPELLARVSTQLRRARYLDVLRQRVDRNVELSMIDQLTGLYNRRFMSEQLQRQMRRAHSAKQPLSVVALDIDHFKQVNDRFGHAAGDRILQELANRLRVNIRPSDVPCRPGGEEFIVIMPATDPAQASRGAERLRRAVGGEPFFASEEEPELTITISVGVATRLDTEMASEDLLRRADEALYRAKAAGRNCVEVAVA